MKYRIQQEWRNDHWCYWPESKPWWRPFYWNCKGFPLFYTLEEAKAWIDHEILTKDQHKTTYHTHP